MRLLGAAIVLNESTGATLPHQAITRWQLEELARQGIGAKAVEKAQAEGRQMTLEEAIEYATRLLVD
ncbi:MAG: hypothetical protein ACRDWA_03075 [Acidimicrobiia bacterium]